MIKNRMKEWLSIQTAKNPGRVVLGAILIFNILFLVFASLVISNLSLSGTEKMNFFAAAFSTIAMILDAGCIQFVIADIGRAGVAVSVFCLFVILVGMVSFTGAVIGYLTNYISRYIESASAGNKRMYLTDHIVLLNWNTRASEIVNDLLYCRSRQIVVVLNESNKQEIRKEVEDRLQSTIAKENGMLLESIRGLPLLTRIRRYHKEKIKNNITLIVREGDVFSSKELHDISLERARIIIILGHDEKNEKAQSAAGGQGNPLTVKALMQVAEITAEAGSNDNQRIVVEITDRWTEQLVERIIATKEVQGKCNIVPVKVNAILGQLLSQFSLMPELNLAYKELFSNRGAAFYSIPLSEEKEEIAYVTEYLRRHLCAIPLTTKTVGGKPYAFFSASDPAAIRTPAKPVECALTVELNHDKHIEDKNVVIIGHNSKCRDIMEGFVSFCNEWHNDPGEREILRVTVIDDRENLERVNYYREYPFVVDTIVGTVYDTDVITRAVDKLSRENAEDTSVLILSDDLMSNEMTDANVLANLVFAQANIKKRMEEPDFDPGSVDIIAEIIDPKHYDVVSTYSVRNVVISNRYISKMITQIGEKDALFELYCDILSYDEDNSLEYESKEIYIKKVTRFFKTLPPPCTASDLIRAVFAATSDPALPRKQRNPTLVLGYVKADGEMILFSDDQTKIEVRIEEKDKLIVFSNH